MLRGIEKWLGVLQNKAWKDTVSAKYENLWYGRKEEIYIKETISFPYTWLYLTQWDFFMIIKCVLASLGIIVNKTNCRSTS